MNIQRFFIFIVVVPFSLHAMRAPRAMPLPGSNEVQHNAVCPGHQLEHQPDYRQLVHLHDKSYYLIEPDGRGLSDHDINRLRQVVPFAVSHAQYNWRSQYASWRWLASAFAGGFLLHALLYRNTGGHLSFLRRCLMISKKAFWGGFLGIWVLGLYAKWPSFHLYDTSDAEIDVGAEISADMFQKSIPCHLSDNQDCPPAAQDYHLSKARCTRMALGNLYVPAADRKQLENTDGPRKPLETYLSQANAPINELLHIPPQYRGKRIFVQEMMKLIGNYELSGDRLNGPQN